MATPAYEVQPDTPGSNARLLGYSKAPETKSMIAAKQHVCVGKNKGGRGEKVC